MNLNGNKSRLLGLTKEITLRWSETRNHWRDARGAEFDHRYMQELQPRVNAAAVAIEKLEELFKRIRKDCE
jgi:murein tripeptide amidase MpaA